MWSFSTPQTLVIDDMESCRDTEGPWIRQTWQDGYEDPANGSIVGNGNAPETGTMHGGVQSLPLKYDNTAAATSAATRTFDSVQDWTRHGVKALVLHVSSDPASPDGQVCLKINETKVPFTGSADALTKPWWTQWTVDLASVGVNLKAVKTISIGVDGAGRTGVLYVDDIALHTSAPAPAGELMRIEAESGQLTTPSAVRTGDLTASAGGYLYTMDAGLTGAYLDGIATYSLTVKGGTYKIQGRVIEPVANGNSFRVRLPAAMLNTTPPAANDGWINRAFPDNARTWQWSDVANADAANTPVYTINSTRRGNVPCIYDCLF